MIKVLLVDDEIDIQIWIADYLRNKGMQVTVSANGAEALTELQKTQYDLIITDLRMPKEDGVSVIYKTLNNIVPKNNKTPILVMTGATKHDRTQMIISGLDKMNIMVLHKPFEPETLMSAVCDILNLSVEQITVSSM